MGRQVQAQPLAGFPPAQAAAIPMVSNGGMARLSIEVTFGHAGAASMQLCEEEVRGMHNQCKSARQRSMIGNEAGEELGARSHVHPTEAACAGLQARNSVTQRGPSTVAGHLSLTREPEAKES